MSVRDYQQLMANPLFQANAGLLATAENPQDALTGLLGVEADPLATARNAGAQEALLAGLGPLGYGGGGGGGQPGPNYMTPVRGAPSASVPADPNGGAPIEARRQGLLSKPQIASDPTAQGFQGGNQNMREMYALMARYADNPAAVGQGYVKATQAQQQIDRWDDPDEQYLRLYGNVNPFDFTAESLDKFHKRYTGTGDIDFSLLQRRETMTSVEQTVLRDAIADSQKAESQVGRFANMADRFDEFARQGIPAGRLAGGLSEWMKGVLGNEDGVTALRTEYNALKNSEVIQSLPPGVASDRDIEIAMRGWPGDTADPAYLASFIRGMQKMSIVKMAQSAHAADYVSRWETQAGQLTDWGTQKEWWVMKALDRVGGVYNPVGPDGKPLNAEEAARLRYESLQGGVGGLNTLTPGGNGPLGGTPDNPLGLPGGTTNNPLGLP